MLYRAFIFSAGSFRIKILSIYMLVLVASFCSVLMSWQKNLIIILKEKFIEVENSIYCAYFHKHAQILTQRLEMFLPVFQGQLWCLTLTEDYHQRLVL